MNKYRTIPDGIDDELQPNSYGRRQNLLIRVVGVAALMIAIVAFASFEKPAVIFQESDSSLHSSTADPEDSDSAQVEVLRVSNEYERALGHPLGDGLYPIDHLAQVNKPTLLQLASGKQVAWEVHNFENFALIDSTAEALDSFTVVFPEVGSYTVHAIDGDTKHEFAITAKIIRYELRTLSDEDRTKYFVALQTFYKVSQEDGERFYGKDYLSLNYLVRQHLYGAASIECDHWHDGAGIVNHHVGITWEMENSLRKIDNTTAAHYWDYTIEYSKNILWYTSDIFDDDWFGSNSPTHPDHVVDKGRWRYTEVMSNARDFSIVTNPYGLLRSPWNSNKIPYLMRYNHTAGSMRLPYHNFPTCEEFAKYISSGRTDFGKISSALNGELHGPVHVMIGGLWGMHAHKNIWGRLFKEGFTTTSNLLLFSKFLWRQGFIRLAESCSSDTPTEDCMPHCPSLITEDADHHAAELLDKAGVKKIFPHWKKMELIMVELNVTRKDFLGMLCKVGLPGEMFTSAAPQDPTFWPLHGNAERYVQYLRVLNSNKTIIFNETWSYDHQGAASDTDLVCDWSNVTEFTDMPTCSKGSCPGHKEDDLLPFKKLFPSQGDKEYTNKEFYNVISPFNTLLPYAYDGLSTWRGCRDSSLLSQSGYVVK